MQAELNVQLINKRANMLASCAAPKKEYGWPRWCLCAQRMGSSTKAVHSAGVSECVKGADGNLEPFAHNVVFLIAD